MGFFQGLLAPILDPLLQLNSFFAVTIMSLVLSLFITVIYKLTTNQKLMKDLKDEMKEFQNEMKELRNNPEKAMEVQKKAMQTNMKYMSHSMRSTLFTMIPILLIFGWMSSNFAFTSINPNIEFTTTLNLYDGQHGAVSISAIDGIEITGDQNKEIIDNSVMWVLKGKEGEYLLEFNVNGMKYYKDVFITLSKKYAQPVKEINDGVVKNIVLSNQKLIVANLFGWKLGWLGTYILLSLVFSSLTRKFLKVY